MTDFKHKTIVITGAAGGLGSAMCLQFGRAGGRIAALDLDMGPLTALKAELEKEGIEVMIHACDLRDETACQQAIEAVKSQWGGVDMLINNAGITQIASFQDSDPAAIHQVMQVNFFGAVAMTHAALDSIIERKGTLVAISSVAGFAPLLGRTAYSASKHAMNGFFGTLRTELVDQEVNVVIVCPSFIGTGFGETAAAPKQTIGKVATAAEVADKVYVAVLKEKRFLVTGNTGKLSFLVRKFAPALYDKMMIRKLRSSAA